MKQFIRSEIEKRIAAGMTRIQVADDMGISYQTVCRHTRDLGRVGPQGRRKGMKVKKTHEQIESENARAIDMLARYQRGETLDKIGQSYGVTRERVRQIVKKNFGITGKDGGIRVAAQAKRQKEWEKFNARWEHKLGGPYREWFSLPNHIRLKYSAHKRNARKIHNTTWHIKPLEWWGLFKAAGAVPSKMVWLTRKNNSLPFTVENCFVATRGEVLNRAWAGKPRKERKPRKYNRLGRPGHPQALISDIIARRGSMSASEIGAVHGLSRNAVIGIWYRHGKSAEQSA